MKKAQIVLNQYSPLMITETDTIITKKGDLPLKRVSSLCRCGNSNSKPYCDGTHMQIGFDGIRTAACHPRKKAYQGNDITIFYDMNLCGHIEECVKGLPTVFNSEKTPWIDAKNASTAEIIEIIQRCPSGALTYQENNHDEVTAWHSESKIEVFENGPYLISQMKLVDDQDSDSALLNDDHYILCRCGQSKKKPFCDGSHHHVDFDDL